MVAGRMLKVDRQLRILEMLSQQRASLRTAEISAALNVSVVTVRRDIEELERQGIVAATRGGVRLLQEGTICEVQYDKKLGEDSGLKEEIAQAALKLIPEGATVFLDGGTAVGALAHHVFRRNLTVITNALNVANVLASSKTVQLILVGGTFRATSQTFLGPRAIRALGELRFDLACMGTEGFDPNRGAEVPDEADAEFKSAAIRLATEVIMLATASTCHKRRLYRFAEWSDIDTLVLGGIIDDATRNDIAARGVSVVMADHSRS